MKGRVVKPIGIVVLGLLVMLAAASIVSVAAPFDDEPDHLLDQTVRPTPGEAPRSREKTGPLVDVAGHLTIAANTDLRPLRGIWRWGVLPVGIVAGYDGSVYWTQYRTNTIQHAAPDGNRVETLADVDGPLGLALDRTDGHLFYITDRHVPRSVGRLQPGRSPEALIYIAGANRPFAIAVAEMSDRIYWTESINGRIRSADTAGSDVSSVFDDGFNDDDEPTGPALSAAGIAIDERHGLVFWSDLRTATIVRARLNGTGRKTILGPDQGLDFPTGLAVDTAAGKLYWGDPGTQTISRADLNGLYPEVVATSADGVLEPYGLAIDAKRRLLYWTDLAHNAIYRASLDLRRVERFIDLDSPPETTAEPSATVASCDLARDDSGREFLRRWVKLIRTCVISLHATKAMMASPYDLKLSAGTCRRQLHQAFEVAALRAALEPHCGAMQVSAAVEDTLQLGAEIIAADLPRSASLLREIRPFVAGYGPAQGSSGLEALAALDALVERLEGLDRTPDSASASTLPASGQTTAYAASMQRAGGMTGAPDDGTIRAGAPMAYVDNGDGTISDPATGLMWEKKCDACGSIHDVNTRVPWRSESGEMDVSGWLRAINSEDKHGFAGHGDWRLPQIAQLLSIVDYERFNPAVSDAFNGSGCGLDCDSHIASECSCTFFNTYWASGGSSPGGEPNIPVVAFNLGLVWAQSPTSLASVRAVRGPVANRVERFVDNADGTVTDRTTGLMWEKKCHCPGDLHDVARRSHWSFDGTRETMWDWLHSVNIEGGSGFAGYNDWRIPNVKELISLFDEQYNDPSIDPVFAHERCVGGDDPPCKDSADGLYRGLHWTSTSFADFPALAVAVGFLTPISAESQPPDWPDVIRIAGGVEPHEKTLRLATRAVRGPMQVNR